MIDPKKQYRTRDGREVRIYAVDGEENYPVHGAVKNHDWSMCYWTAHGRACNSAIESRLDLIEMKPRIKRTVWMNVYPGYEHSFSSKHDAECGKHPGRIACAEIDIDVEEGHGL